MNDRERELTAATEDLTDTLEALREELQSPPRGPGGLPRPPTPGELFRFTEQYTIPALISLLETSIRVLELLGGAIRLAEGRAFDDSNERTDHLAEVSRSTLRKLDDALAEVQNAAAGGQPDDPEVRRLLGEARSLREEVDDRLAAATDRPESDRKRVDDSVGITVRDASEDDAVGIDVDAELESIKREVDGEESDESTDGGDGQTGSNR